MAQIGSRLCYKPCQYYTKCEKAPTQLEGNGDDQVTFLAVMESECRAKTKMCAAAVIDDTTARDAIDGCAIPQFNGPPQFGFPECLRPSFAPIVEDQGLLCQWALAFQEYDFDIIYHKGLLNSNADALSQREDAGETDQVAITVASHSPRKLWSAQQEDAVTKQISKALSESHHRPRTQAWRKPHYSAMANNGPN